MIHAEPMPAAVRLRGEMADIDVTGLVKRYGDVVAVDGLSFSVQKGEVFGMLGPTAPARRRPWRSSRASGYPMPAPSRSSAPT